MECLVSCYHRAMRATHYASDALLLAMRLWIANIFFKSGLTKLDDWETTLFLFAEEYKVPLIPAELAAYSGTFFELVCPVLLVLGFGARLSALQLLIMTAVIQFTYLEHEQHVYWAFVLASILCFGAGRLSVDYLIKRRFAA